MMLWPSWPGSFGDGNCLKYCEAARLGPIPSGSIAAICEGVRPYQPASTLWLLLKPRTDPPGHCAATAQRYSSHPSRNEFEGTLRTTGVSLSDLSRSTLAKKKRRFLRMGPPSDAP